MGEAAVLVHAAQSRLWCAGQAGPDQPASSQSPSLLSRAPGPMGVACGITACDLRSECTFSLPKFGTLFVDGVLPIPTVVGSDIR